MLFIAAAYTAFWSLHPVLLIEVALIVTGFCLILLRFLLFPVDSHLSEEASEQESAKQTIAARILMKLTLNNRLRPYFPILAIFLLVFVYSYNRFLSPRSDLGNGDYLLMAIAGVLLVYNLVPNKFSVERDFVLIFLILIFFLLIVPLALYTLYIGDPDVAPSSLLIHYLVSVPATFLSNLMGIPASAHFNSAIGSYIHFGNNNVGIALGCSGLYSVIIFSSAYVTYIISNFVKLERKLLYALLLGLVLAWFANAIRISLTVGAGYWWDMAALQWFHENIGILIFLAWIAVFWYLVFRFVAPEALPRKEGSGSKTEETT